MGPTCTWLKINDAQNFDSYTGICFDPNDSMDVKAMGLLKSTSRECSNPTFLSQCTASCAKWGNTATDWRGAEPYIETGTGDNQNAPAGLASEEDKPPWPATVPLGFRGWNKLQELSDVQVPDDPPTVEYETSLVLEMRRLLTCDPLNSMRIIQHRELSDDDETGYSATTKQAISMTADVEPWGPLASESATSVSEIDQLGTCGVLTDGAGQSACWKSSKYSVPLLMDATTSDLIQKFNLQLQKLFDDAVDNAAILVNAGSRLSAAGKSALGLLPITFALMPGLVKGAKKVKQIIPQTPLVSYILVVVPPLQLPLIGAIMCFLIQLGGTWLIWGSVLCVIAFLLAPIMQAWFSTGPHENGAVFKKTHSFHTKQKDGTWKPRSLAPILISLLVAALGLLAAGFQDQFSSMSVIGTFHGRCN
jgi:hypothetical protein